MTETHTNPISAALALLTYFVIAVVSVVAWVLMLPFRFVIAVLWFVNTGSWVFSQEKWAATYGKRKHEEDKWHI